MQQLAVQVYNKAGLLTSRSICALTQQEMWLMAERGTAVAHCPPTSTLGTVS
jgi:cytosine/adenosine deaminase-related metal-dependent hydrolase